MTSTPSGSNPVSIYKDDESDARPVTTTTTHAKPHALTSRNPNGKTTVFDGVRTDVRAHIKSGLQKFHNAKVAVSSRFQEIYDNIVEDDVSPPIPLSFIISGLEHKKLNLHNYISAEAIFSKSLNNNLKHLEVVRTLEKKIAACTTLAEFAAVSVPQCVLNKECMSRISATDWYSTQFKEDSLTLVNTVAAMDALTKSLDGISNVVGGIRTAFNASLVTTDANMDVLSTKVGALSANVDGEMGALSTNVDALSTTVDGNLKKVLIAIAESNVGAKNHLDRVTPVFKELLESSAVAIRTALETVYLELETKIDRRATDVKEVLEALQQDMVGKDQLLKSMLDVNFIALQDQIGLATAEVISAVNKDGRRTRNVMANQHIEITQTVKKGNNKTNHNLAALASNVKHFENINEQLKSDLLMCRDELNECRVEINARALEHGSLTAHVSALNQEVAVLNANLGASNTAIAAQRSIIDGHVTTIAGHVVTIAGHVATIANERVQHSAVLSVLEDGVRRSKIAIQGHLATIDGHAATVNEFTIALAALVQEHFHPGIKTNVE